MQRDSYVFIGFLVLVTGVLIGRLTIQTLGANVMDISQTPTTRYPYSNPIVQPTA